MPGPAEFDLFLSCAGPDREQVRALHQALEKAGIRVFYDEREIRLFEPISDRIERALGSAKALLAYYSVHYPRREACQVELTAAFLAGQRDGDPMRRIIVVNPEDPRSGHLLPAELADARYGLLPATGQDTRELVRSIKDRLRGLDGTIGEVRLTRRSWFGRPAGAPGFVGRYRDQWALHTALRDADFRLTRSATSAPVAALVGMPGIGKTSLAAAYAWNFGADYADGAVCWIRLDGAPAPVLDRYAEQVRALAEDMGLDAGGLSLSGLATMVADALDRRPGPTLWVVDDVPTGLDPDTVRELILPSRSRLRTVLVTRADDYRDVATTVRVDPLGDEEAGLLLSRYRAPAEDELTDFEHLLPALRGHPMAIALAGEQLRDRVGLVSFAQYAQRLADEPDTLAVVADLLAERLRRLSAPARLVLQLALAGARAALPARFVGPVVDRLLPGRGPDPAGDALVELKDLALAGRDGGAWQVHALVLDAARRHLDPPVPTTDLVRVGATVLDELVLDPTLSSTDRRDLVQHLVALAGGLPRDRAARSLSRVAAHYEERGEPVVAAPLRDRLADLDPGPASALAAAVTHLAAGNYERAVTEAERAGRLAGADSACSHPARRTLAEALDAQARYQESERHWAELLAATTPVEPVEMLRTRLGRLRNLRLRGRMDEVRRAAPALVAAATAADRAGEPAAFDLAQAAELDLARAELLTDDQVAARTRAGAVAERYAQRGMPAHALALAAQEVLAEARLTLHLWELNPDRHHWRKAVAELRELRQTFRASHGETNPLTLGVEVDFCFALISQGHRAEGRQEIDRLRPRLEHRLGPRHPLSCRATFLDGLLHAQQDELGEARLRYEQALDGQRAALGAGHAHTLRTQYELAVTLRLLGDDRWHHLMNGVRQLAPDAVGRHNDLYVQACLALGLLSLPVPVIRTVVRWGRPRR